MAYRTIQAVIDPNPVFNPKDRFWRLALFPSNADGTPAIDPDTMGGAGPVDLSLYTGDVNIAGNLAVSEEVSAATAAANSAQVGDAGILFGVAQDVNLYRFAADVLRTDDNFAIFGSDKMVMVEDGAESGVYVGPGSVWVNFPTGTDNDNSRAFAVQGWDAPVARFSIATSGKLQWGDGAVGADVNLYRSAVDTLKTDDTFSAANLSSAGTILANGNQSARNAAAQKVTSGNVGPANEAGIQFGSAADTNLYRSGVDTLKTDDTFAAAAISVNGGTPGASAIVAGGNVIPQNTGAGKTQVGAVGPSSEAGLVFGSAADTNLYRSAADTLRTDDTLLVGGALTISGGIVTAQRAAVGDISFAARLSTDSLSRFATLADGKHEWGDGALARDTNLYRSAVGTLKTDHRIYTGDTVSVIDGSANRVRIGALGPASEAALVFGSAGDTNLYRSAADNLRTDDTFQAAGIGVLSGAISIQHSGPNGFIETRELAGGDPTAPAVDRIKIYAKDNGAGKTQLCVRFATGAAVVIATEA